MTNITSFNPLFRGLPAASKSIEKIGTIDSKKLSHSGAFSLPELEKPEFHTQLDEIPDPGNEIPGGEISLQEIFNFTKKEADLFEAYLDRQTAIYRIIETRALTPAEKQEATSLKYQMEKLMGDAALRGNRLVLSGL